MRTRMVGETLFLTAAPAGSFVLLVSDRKRRLVHDHEESREGAAKETRVSRAARLAAA